MTTLDSDLAAAHADLLRAVSRLDALLSHADAAEDLELLRTVAMRLASDRTAPPLPRKLQSYDPTRFHRLLELAGPTNSRELIAQLSEDLSHARNTVEQAARACHWSALREASHILISLTGSVGALSLQDMSERLNAATHSEDRSLLTTLVPGMLAELDILLAIIGAMPPNAGSAA
jgi:HPt (histidine-containing phosphotransfer) domain-containing protein